MQSSTSSQRTGCQAAERVPPPTTAANRLGLDYCAEAATFLSPEELGTPIIDVHSHINGDEAAAVYDDVRKRYGVALTYSMTQYAQAETVRERLGETIRFIAVPDYASSNGAHAFQQGYMDRITDWHALGARMCKFWVAPRSRDYAREFGDPELMSLDNEWRTKQIEHAANLGMMFMCHVADPDTWFQTKYTDSAFYGTKRDQYAPLERAVARTPGVPWLLAHMGGWPEDLDFLDGLLDRNANLYLDTSATKWMVRELSKHRRKDFVEFFTRYKGRILFGSDIVSTEMHVGAEPTGRMTPNMDVKTRADAFDLYASRYWALRTLLETDYAGESPIADPDLAMVEPDLYNEMSAPELCGKGLPIDVLRSVYFEAAQELLGEWYAT